MTLFRDASAMLAIIFDEPEASKLLRAIDGDAARITSGTALWETARAIARHSEGAMIAGQREAERFCDHFAIDIVPIDRSEAAEAAAAFDRFGKRCHPADLNMGDCFAYACAKTNGAGLVYKGNDFAQTDLA